MEPVKTTLDHLLYDESSRVSKFDEVEIYLTDDGTLVEWLEDLPFILSDAEDALLRAAMMLIDAADANIDRNSHENVVLTGVGYRFTCSDYSRSLAKHGIKYREGENAATYIPVYSIEKEYFRERMEERNGLAT